MVAEERDDSRRSDDFDPRYDPAFQRGYQPRPGEQTRTRVRSDAPDSAYRRPSSLLRSLDEPGTAPEPVAAAEPSALAFADRLPADRLPADADLLPSVAAAPVVVSSPELLDRLELNPRRNPFVLSLWLVGAGFVVLGIVLYCISVTSSYSGPTPSTDVGALVFAQLGWMLAGPLITVGLITLVALLFLTALAVRRGPAAVAPPEDEL